jgi:hypothetical protein
MKISTIGMPRKTEPKLIREPITAPTINSTRMTIAVALAAAL